MTNPFLQEAGVYQVIGPPGTGKTTWLINTITEALTHGIISDGVHMTIAEHDVTVVAFTRAAAVNAWQRLQAAGIDIPQENIGTMHSLTLRAMIQTAEENGAERPRLFGDARSTGLWNERYPEDLVSQHAEDEDTVTKATTTDKRFTMIDGLRARLTPVEEWPADLRELHERFTEFKLDEGYLDFTDLITQATETGMLPLGVALLLADEAQDFSPLEWQLLNFWSSIVNRTALIGDDDQAIYSGLKGASPEHFVNLDIPEGHRLVLSQSYRVPGFVHALAECITDSISLRLPKQYNPREEEGSLRHSLATWQNPYPMLPNLKALGGSVMILAYSKYMLEPTLLMLRDALIPFHNPYRPAYAAWNPLGQDHAAGTTIRTRLLAFQKPEWTARDVSLWIAILANKGVFPRGMRDRLKDDLETLEDDVIPDLRAYFEADALAALERRDLDFVEAHTPAKIKNGRYKMCMNLARQGMLGAQPRIVVGTIHSVKGGEADTVILYPDYPDAAAEESAQDDNLRVMYVGATRALHTLVIGTSTEARGGEDADPTCALQTMRLIRRARARHLSRMNPDLAKPA